MSLKKKNYHVHVIPHSHIDVEWYWTYDETRKRVWYIIKSVLDRMREGDDFTFAQDQAALFQPLLDYLNKGEQKYLQKLIKKGRFEIVGGMWVQPEVAIPHPEVLIRNTIKGRQWFFEKLGVNVETAWQIDGFSQCQQLPQILKKSGFKYFVFSRGVPEEIASTLPNVFFCQSPDGSRILTHWLCNAYGGAGNLGIAGEVLLPRSGKLCWELFYKCIPQKWLLRSDEFSLSSINRVKKEWLEVMRNKSPKKILFFPLGNDNFIPDSDIFDVVKLLNRELKDYHFFFSTPSKFFKEFERKGLNLKTFDCEFSLPLRISDGRGLWVGRCELKKAQREVENTVLAVEKFATISHLLGTKYPETELKLAWGDLIFNSFHDIIYGSHTDDVYLGAMRRHGKLSITGRVMQTGNLLLEKSLQRIVSGVSPAGKDKNMKEKLVVFNPLSWARNDVVKTQLAEDYKLIDEKGETIPAQITKNKEALFIGRKIPSLGYRTFRIVRDNRTRKAKPRTDLLIQKDRMENRWWGFAFETSGGIRSIYDKKAKRELLDTEKWLGNELICQKHDGDLEGPLNLRKLIWRMKSYKQAKVEIEKGPIFGQVRFNGTFKGGRREQIITLYRDLPRIDFETRIDLRETGLLISTRFPLNLKKIHIWHETPYAVTARPDGIYPAQNWVAVEGKDYGTAIINKGNPGYRVEGNCLDLVLLWSVEQVKPRKSYNAPLARELGVHTFEYSLYPYHGDWQKSGLIQRGQELNSPPIPILAKVGEKAFPPEREFIGIRPENLIITVFKKTEEGNNVILRGYEATGQGGEGKIKLFFPVSKAWKTDLNENKIKTITSSGNTLRFKFKAFEIFTILIEPAS